MSFIVDGKKGMDLMNIEKTELYFGQLQLTINSPRPVNWREQERRFSVPCLPVKKHAEVNVSFVRELRLPVSSEIHRAEAMEVFQGDAEERVYYPRYVGNQKAAACSWLDGDLVSIMQLDDERNLWNNPNYSLLTFVHMEQLLLETEAVVLHSCYTEYEGQAILFTAPSGTGKTTQAGIWKRVYGSTIVNGDKCLLQKTETGFYACGFFLHGSAEECENRSMPIKAIVIVRQSERDYIEELSAAQKIGLLYTEITVNSWNRKSIMETMALLEDLVSCTRVVMLHCTMMDSAAHVLHDYLYRD